MCGSANCNERETPCTDYISAVAPSLPVLSSLILASSYCWRMTKVQWSKLTSSTRSQLLLLQHGQGDLRVLRVYSVQVTGALVPVSHQFTISLHLSYKCLLKPLLGG